MRDFILDKLKKKRSIYESISNEEMRDFMVLMKREYLIRLMLAVLWDACYGKCSSNEKSKIVKLLFDKKPSLGDFVSAMRSLCQYSPERRLYEKICDNTCKQPIYNRNQDAHKISAQNDQMIHVIDKWVEGIAAEGCHLFSDSDTDNAYDYLFMIPLRETSGGRVQCICFGMDGNYTTPIMEGRLFKKGMRQLYYYVENRATEEKEVYKLSPFIHYFEDPVNGIFTLYNSTISKANNKLVLEARSLFDERLNDKSEDVILSERSCRLTFEADFPMTHMSENFYISAFNNIMVNKSSYHMFEEVANNKYRYFESIVQDYCSVVYRFCTDRKSQPFLVIAGGGGLGKTALLLNVIQKIMGNELKRAEYDLIIFLSAKQNYLEDRTTKTLQMIQTDDNDIVDFDSFKRKLWKYVFDLSDEEMAERYKKIEGAEAKDIIGQKKSVLLMVDDLDMLVPEEQEKICEFVKSIPASKMKSIIATRNVNTNGEKIEMQRLDQERCVKFAKWLIENGWEKEGRFWLDRLEEEKYQKSVSTLSRGIPVFVQKWVRMLVENVNLLNVDNIFTERDCIKYLYYTVKNQLKPKEAQLIYLIKETCRLCKTRVYEPFFLYVFCSAETQEEMNQCLRSLISFQLIQDNGNSTYSPFDFDYTCIDIRDEGYYGSEIYRLIFESMEKNPDIWRNRVEYLNEIIRCLDMLSQYDSPAALLLDKLCSDYGIMYCSVPQSRKLMELRNAREAVSDTDAELAYILGGWDGRTYDIGLMDQILDRISQDSYREESLEKALGMIVDCCEKQANEAENTADDAYKQIREFARMRERMYKIKDSSEKIKESKKRLAQKIREMENW